MRLLLAAVVLAFLATAAMAQPPGPPPGPPRGSGSGSTAAPQGTPQYVVGTVYFLSSSKITVNRQPTGSAQPETQMDFTLDDKSRVAAGLQSQDRVVVVYEVAGGTNLYRAVLAAKCPEGANPEEVIRNAARR